MGTLNTTSRTASEQVSNVAYRFLHPDTFITLGELAGVLRDQDKLEEAQETYERLLKARIQVLGEVGHCF